MERRFEERQVRLENQVRQQAEAVSSVNKQLQVVQRQLVEQLKAQFSRLTLRISESLHLTRRQVTVLQSVVDGHLQEITRATEFLSLESPLSLADDVPDGSQVALPDQPEETGVLPGRDPRLQPRLPMDL